MANKNQQRGGQQDHNFQGSRNQMGQGAEGGQSGQGRGGQQSAYQDNQGQFGGNYGPDTNYRGPQEYGNYGLSRDSGYNPRETNANDNWEPENSRGSRGFGHSQSYGGAMGHQDDSQRGSQNWQQFDDRFSRSGSQAGGNQGGNHQGSQGLSGNAGHHHDPDYHQWRTEQISNLDNDYKAWRDERYSKFSSEFGEWRKGRNDKQSSGGSTGAGGSNESDSSSTGNATQGSAGTSSKSK